MVISVVTSHSAAAIWATCGLDDNCQAKLRRQNEDLMREIANVIEVDLKQFGLDESLFQRILLVPLCSLGTDANGVEKDSSCSASKHSGKYLGTFFPYVSLAPFYKVSLSFLLQGKT